jgi:cytoskeletal protein CcmA (bactofilin family)
MFNKPTITNRNDLVTRRDTTNIQGAATASAFAPAANTTPAPIPRAEKTETPSNTENVMGARLIVGPDVKLKGAEILDCDTLVVEGRVEATMDSRVIRIAENGSFSGKVSIDIAEIHGSFEGELTARSQLIIHATGKVHGKIRYGKLVIDEGGELCGDINALSAEKTTAFQLRDEPVKALTAVAG